MQTRKTHDAEVDHLRQLTRNLIALSTLPAIWAGLQPEGVIKSLAKVFLTTLDLDLVYIRLADSNGSNVIESVSSRRHDDAQANLPVVRAILDPFLAELSANQPATISDPFGDGIVRINFVRFGIAQDSGVVVAGSRRTDFPSEHDRLLMGVGANQAAAVVQRHRTELALRQSEKRFLDLGDTAPAMLWVTEPDGYCSFLARGWYEFTGQKESEGLGFGWIDAIHPDDRERSRKAFADANEQKKEFVCEHRVLHADGSYRWVIDTGRPRLSSSGEFLGLVGNVLDNTQRKLLEQELQEAGRRKDEFLAMLAHELRNPLAPISAGAELLRMVRLDDAQVRQTSEIIGRQVSHMTNLIDDLLDVSRVTRGLVKLESAALDIRHVITDAVEQVNPLIRVKRHNLALHLPPATTIVLGDSKRLVQILANLLNNAAKYTPENGNITLRTEVQDAHVLLEVIDDGIGMTPDLVKRAFDLFVQAERTPDRSSGGLGLGLALVKSLVELHGGTVTASSAGTGKGSKFTVFLPRLCQSENETAKDRRGNLQSSAQPLKILVVDDNMDGAAMLSMLLEADGHQVLAVHSAMRALETARAEAPDVCLLDIGLPDMDGNELALRLRSLPATKKSVLIAITGYGREEDRKDTRDAGFDHHLVKPVDMKQLLSVLAEVKVLQ
jgi:PAS domain S-box-containing protein